MTTARRRKGASVNGNSDEGLVGFRRREFRNRDSRTRFILLAMTTSLNETDYVRPESIPRVAIGAEELQGDVNAMVPHQVVMVVS